MKYIEDIAGPFEKILEELVPVGLEHTYKTHTCSPKGSVRLDEPVGEGDKYGTIEEKAAMCGKIYKSTCKGVHACKDAYDPQGDKCDEGKTRQCLEGLQTIGEENGQNIVTALEHMRKAGACDTNFAAALKEFTSHIQDFEGAMGTWKTVFGEAEKKLKDGQGNDPGKGPGSDAETKKVGHDFVSWISMSGIT